MKALTTADINNILLSNSSTKRYFIGTFPACIIPKTNKKKYFFISNTASHEHPGKHWIVWKVNGDNVLFFDTFGRSPFDKDFPEYFKDFAKLFKTINHAQKMIQYPFSVACGYFCINFVYDLSYDLSLESFLSKFSSNLQENDKKVYEIVNSII